MSCRKAVTAAPTEFVGTSRVCAFPIVGATIGRPRTGKD